MKETDLLEAIRSLLRADEMDRHRSYTYSSSPDARTRDEESDADGVAEDFPIPAERDGELRDVLIELNVTTHEYILMALEHHGGRLRQQEIADLTDWSEPTVSQKLSEMEDEDLITRFRTGREKIVCLPDESPVDVSPTSVDAEGSSVDSRPSSVDADGTPRESDGSSREPDSTPENPDTPSQ